MHDAHSSDSQVTQLLQAAGAGDAAAARQVYEHLYTDLRRIARARLQRGAEPSQLSTTGLVHEAFLRLWGKPLPTFESTEHFLAYASRTMRSVVVDLARARQAVQRGGGADHLVLDTQLGDSLAAPDDEVIHIDQALAELERTEPRLAQVVELRYFAGLTDAEVAAALGLNERTVQRDWAKARLILARLIR